MESHNQVGLTANQDEWCLGWKMTGSRPLTSAELDELQQERNRLLRNKWGFGCGCPIVFFAPLFVFAAFFDMGRTDPGAAEWAAAVLIVLLAPSAWMLLRAGDANKQVQGRLSDLSAGVVKRFAGTRDKFEQPGWLADANLPPAPDAAGWIEVLPHSQSIFSIVGTRPQRWLPAPIAVLATTPESAAQSAYWHRAGGGNDVTLRALSPAEKEEVVRHSRTIWRRPLSGALFLDLWLGVPLALHLVTGTPIKVEAMAYVIGAMAALSNWNLWRAYVLSRKMARDVEAGQVALLRPPLKTQLPDASAPDASAVELRATLWEVLPESGLIWTADSAPASWRKSKG